MFGQPADWEYPLAITAATAVGTAMFVRRLRNARVPAGRVLLFILGITLGAIIGGRLHTLVESGTSWTWAALFESGYRHPGAIAGLILSVAILRPLLLPAVSLARLADALAPPAAFAMATMRLGCLAAGCCFGVVSDLPWAVHFPMGSLAANLHSTMGWLEPGATESLPVHPLPIYFAILAIGTGAFLLWLERRQRYVGEIALSFLAVHETGKFLLEFLRAPGPTPATAGVQIFSLLAALVAVTAITVIALAKLSPPRVAA